MNLPYEDSLCTKCSSADIGDEFHYVFSYPFFAESRNRQNYLFGSKNEPLLVNLARFLKFIMSEL